MSVLFMKVLSKFGIQKLWWDSAPEDPTTEEELFAIDFKTEQPVTWEEYITKYNELKQAEGLKLLRRKRDQLLKNTDWLMTVDVSNTIANIEEFKAYRQALRDLPETTVPILKKTETFVEFELDLEAMNFPVLPKIQKVQTTQ